MIDFKKELNSAQYEVVSGGDGPVLVLAGAGSGKTRTLTYRVAYLLQNGVKPEQILLLTFTNKAAHEMLDRVEQLVPDKKLVKGLWGGTFHSVANRLLRKMGSAINLKPNFSILDREDSKTLIKRAMKESTGAGSKRRLPKPGIFLEVISFAANARCTIEEALESKYPEGLDILDVFQSVAKRYRDKKEAGNALDFDDLLTYWLRLLEVSAARKKLQHFWKYVLVDEYQDTNVVQDAIVRAIASEHQNLLVVGDDAQSIYSFRAANIQNILQFPKNFPNAKTFKLERNYRSTPEILDVANNVIEQNVDQFQKALYTEIEPFIKPEVHALQDPDDEASMIADRIQVLEDQGEKLENMAVLFRAAHQSQALELELNKRRIPYEIRGGLRFFERAHIKDMLAFLRLLHNPLDEASWFRVLNLYEGVGDATAQKLLAQAIAAEQWDAILQLPPVGGKAAASGWSGFVKTMKEAYAVKDDSPGEIIRSLLPFYRSYAELQFTDYKDRIEDIEQLAIFADRYDSLEQFVAETALQESYAMRGNEAPKDERGIVLSTIHQAKGLEWNAVFLIRMTNQSLPHPKAAMEQGGLEEERRLFYVAITRARRRLYLTYPVSTSAYSLSLSQPSSFLSDIDKKLLSGKVVEDDETSYISIDDDGNRSYLPSVDQL